MEVVTILRQEIVWQGTTPEAFRAIPNKPALQFDGHPVWAEFTLLRLLERHGWKGAWVKNWGGRAFWSDVLEITELPPSAEKLFYRIDKRAGTGAGCWDILASRGDDVFFLESKQRGRDEIRLSQRVWLENALGEGVPLSSFMIAEWERIER